MFYLGAKFSERSQGHHFCQRIWSIIYCWNWHWVVWATLVYSRLKFLSHIIYASNRVGRIMFLSALRTIPGLSFSIGGDARDWGRCLVWTPCIFMFDIYTHTWVLYTKQFATLHNKPLSQANSGFDCCCLWLWINTITTLVRWLSIAYYMQ